MPKHSKKYFISVSFALNWYIFVALTNKKKSYFYYSLDLIKIFFLIVPSNPCVALLPRIKISFSLLSICPDELIPTPKMITFLPPGPSDKEYYPRESDPTP